MQKAWHEVRSGIGAMAIRIAAWMKLGRSALVGVAATFADLVALEALVRTADLSPAAANLPALGLGLVVQFFGNKYFAFQDRSRAVARQGAQFALVEAGAVALNAGIFHVLVTSTSLPYLVARLLATTVVYFAFSYPLWNLIFRDPAMPDRELAG